MIEAAFRVLRIMQIMLKIMLLKRSMMFDSYFNFWGGSHGREQDWEAMLAGCGLTAHLAETVMFGTDNSIVDLLFNQVKVVGGVKYKPKKRRRIMKKKR